MSEPEFLPMEILSVRFNTPAETLNGRIQKANKRKAGTVRTRGPRHFREYAVEDVRAIAGGQRGTYRRRVG